MAKLSAIKGTTSLSVYVFIGDSSVTTGAGKTGLAYNTSSLVAYYVQPRGTPTAITLATLANAQSAYSSGGFIEVDATNMPGIYRLDVPNAALTGANSVVVMLKGATNMVPVALEIELTGWDNMDAVRGGLTALPNANAGANGGLPTGDASGRVDVSKIAGSAVSTSTAQIGVNVVNFGGSAGTFSSGRPEVNTTHIGGTSQTARDLGASVLLSNGTGTGQVSLSSGTVTVGTNNDKTGYALSSAGVQAIWDALTSALTTASSIGKLLVDNINATISSRLASASYTAPLDAAGTRTAIGLASANLDTQLTAIDDYLDTEIAAIKAQTDLIPASPAATGDAMTLTSGERNSVADALLNRDMSAVTVTNARSPINALRWLRNKWTVSGATLTVMKEDDVTSAWTATLTTNSSADPVTGSDPS